MLFRDWSDMWVELQVGVAVKTPSHLKPILQDRVFEQGWCIASFSRFALFYSKVWCTSQRSAMQPEPFTRAAQSRCRLSSVGLLVALLGSQVTRKSLASFPIHKTSFLLSAFFRGEWREPDTRGHIVVQAVWQKWQHKSSSPTTPELHPCL